MSRYLKQLQSYPFSDILGWSNSRHDTYQSCRRKYYYQYYAKYDREYDVRDIRMLAALTSPPLEVGITTHEILEILLKRLQRSFEPIDETRLFDYARRHVNKSMTGRFFADVYYKQKNSIDIEEEIVQPVIECLTNFLNSDRMRWIFEEALANKDDWIIEMPSSLKFGECRIGDIKAYCKVDFLFPMEDDEIHIIDWKTGKEMFSKYNIQLTGYAGWAKCMFDLDFAKIKTTVAYLRPDYVEKSIELNEYDLENFAATVKSQSQEMYALCSDVESNVPLPKENFPMTNSVNFCKTCNFRQLCKRN